MGAALLLPGLWLAALRAADAQGLGSMGMDATAVGATGTTGTDATVHGGKASCAECVDSETWVSPDSDGGCATYRVGEVNEGYCGSDQAYTPCPLACDSCPKCTSDTMEVDGTMLWLGIPCIIFGLCAPLIKTTHWHLTDNRKTIVQQRRERESERSAAQQLPDPPLELEELERQQAAAASLGAVHEGQEEEQQLQWSQSKIDALSAVERSA